MAGRRAFFPGRPLPPTAPRTDRRQPLQERGFVKKMWPHTIFAQEKLRHDAYNDDTRGAVTSRGTTRIQDGRLFPACPYSPITRGGTCRNQRSRKVLSNRKELGRSKRLAPSHEEPRPAFPPAWPGSMRFSREDLFPAAPTWYAAPLAPVRPCSACTSSVPAPLTAT